MKKADSSRYYVKETAEKAVKLALTTFRRTPLYKRNKGLRYSIVISKTVGGGAAPYPEVFYRKCTARSNKGRQVLEEVGLSMLVRMSFLGNDPISQYRLPEKLQTSSISSHWGGVNKNGLVVSINGFDSETCFFLADIIAELCFVFGRNDFYGENGI